MKNAVVIKSVDLDGTIDGFLELVVPQFSPSIRFTSVVFAPEFDMGDEDIGGFFQVGKKSIRELWIQFVLNWRSTAAGSRFIRQPKKGSAHTVVSGQVTALLGATDFLLDCGLVISVEFDKGLPSVGQWVSLEGTLVCWPEGFSDS